MTMRSGQVSRVEASEACLGSSDPLTKARNGYMATELESIDYRRWFFVVVTARF